MGPKPTPPCAVCNQASKYRCSACPVRYCSVACYKTHKQTCTAQGGSAPAPILGESSETAVTATTTTETSSAATSSATAAPTTATAAAESSTLAPAAGPTEARENVPLRALTSLRWPPQPDASVFMDPLKRDDPKPLRHAELERIATSQDLRDLLVSPVLVRVLTALDALPTSNARHAALGRILGVDSQSLARPAAGALMAGRGGSPPPLDEILGGVMARDAGRDDWGADGWWLGRGEDKESRVWIGEEERRLMKIWAGVVVASIDGEGEGSWGEGALEWEI